MKKQFFDYLIQLMEENKDIYFISCGLGWPRTDEIKEKFPDRYIQTEASEATALDICVGLAYAGKIPVVYTITPFLLRGFETVRTYINHEVLHVIMIGAGRNDDYSKHDGFSHDATDIKEIFDTQKNIVQMYPENEEEMKAVLNVSINTKTHESLKQIGYLFKPGPVFISIPR